MVEKTETVFAKSYARLNPNQKQAVDTLDGPVMVVAGPGTGKTQVLALRTANILRSTQMRPGNILCLTFSKSGATAMRNRLREMIGPDAYGVTVNTIHGFCNDIIVRHPMLFEDWSSQTQITDIERYRTLNKIIDQLLPACELVSPKSPYARTKDILARISQLKREGVTDISVLRDVSKQFTVQMDGKSKEGTKAHARNVSLAKKFDELITIFDLYQQQLAEKKRYDYEDMILNVIEALEQEDWLLASLQERYQYILVDEFQDTNGAQYQLLDLLSSDPTGDNAPNIFVVGDDDQAIYRFQGANLQNILRFRDRFPDAPVIPLTTSYRCSQSILDAANALISCNTERLTNTIDDLEKNLESHEQEAGVEPELLLTPSDTAEPWVVADMVEQAIADGTDANEIAVLTQTNRELITLYEVFQSKGIATVLSGRLDLLSHPLVEQVVAILQAVAEPGASSTLSSALASECFSCHPADLGTLFCARRDQKKSLLELLLDLEHTELTLRNAEALMNARDIILDLHNKKDQRTVLQTLEAIYTCCNLLGDPIDVLDFAAAQEFFERAQQRSSEQPDLSFEAFLADITYYLQEEYSDLRLSYDLPHLTESGVQLMTAHKSKGLEFEMVIMTNFREGHWDKRRNPPSVSVPEDLLFGWTKDTKTWQQHQDERRVAFVGMTRAKKRLLFTCPITLSAGDTVKDVAPSGFIAEAQHVVEKERAPNSPEAMSTLIATPPRHIDTEFAAFLKNRIEHFALSPTALNHFLEDPQLFLEVDLLQTPQAKEPHFAYGNAVHHVLAKWAISLESGAPISEQQMLQAFSEHLEHREVLTEKERERLEHLGHQSLPRYIASHLQAPYPIVHKVEYAIHAHLVDPSSPLRAGVPLKGKLDRIDLLEPRSCAAIITDFKTGKPKSEKQIIDYGYHRQLVFYDLLVRNGYSIIEPKEFRLEFIGEGLEAPKTCSFSITQQDRKELTDLINLVWGKILALDFTEV